MSKKKSKPVVDDGDPTKAIGYIPPGGMKLMYDFEQLYGLPSGLIPAMLEAETGSFRDRAHAVSSSGAKGWLQFMDDTAEEYDVITSDFQSSVAGNAKMMSVLQNKFDDLPKSLAGYNWGRRYVINDPTLSEAPAHTRKYIKDVQEYMQKYDKGADYFRFRKEKEKKPSVKPPVKESQGFFEMVSERLRNFIFSKEK